MAHRGVGTQLLGPRKVLLPVSASLGSCSVAQPGSGAVDSPRRCRVRRFAVPAGLLRRIAVAAKVAPSWTATFTGCPPSRTYELAEDPRTAAGHAVVVCEPAGDEDAAGRRHSDRHHHPSGRAGRHRPDHHRDDHRHFARTDGRLLPASVRRGTAAGTELAGDNELQSSIWKRQRDHALARRVADADRYLQPGRSGHPCHQRFGMEQAEDRHRGTGTVACPAREQQTRLPQCDGAEAGPQQ